jgi:hypothetical protein
MSLASNNVDRKVITCVSIMLTERCNANCAHCIVDSGPAARGDFNSHWFTDIVCAMAKHGISTLGISGGEPLLLFRETLSLARLAKKHGIRSVLATNAFWGNRMKNAATVATQIGNAGIAKVIVSSDQYHEPFVPIPFVANAVRALSECGIEYEVHVSAVDVKAGRQHEAKLEGVGVTHVLCCGLESAGRAINLVSDTNHRGPATRCLKTTNPLILVDGTVIACCDLLAAKEYRPIPTSPLHLGRIPFESMAAILDRAQSNPVLGLLNRVGPETLSWRLRPKSHSPAANALSGCRLCHSLFGSVPLSLEQVTALKGMQTGSLDRPNELGPN